MEILLWSVVAIIATGIVWKGSGQLEKASERIATYYSLSEVTKGAVVVAIGSSFPELSTVVISTLVYGEFELGVAAIVGSALFNILIIPAICGLSSKKQLRANRDLVYKEAQFYMISVAVLTLTFAFAVIYQPVSPETGSEHTILGEMTRWLALMPIGLYALYLFVQYQDNRDQDNNEYSGEISIIREWLKLGLSLIIIVAGVEGLVRAAINFGEIFDTPSFLWGATVVAAGTSIPDAFVSVRAARKGNGVTSIANVLGSNTFDLLVCIPVGVLIAGSTIVNFSVAAPMMAVLTAATIVLFLAMRTHMILSRMESVALLILYFVFLAWISLESFGVVDLVPGLPPVA